MTNGVEVKPEEAKPEVRPAEREFSNIIYIGMIKPFSRYVLTLNSVLMKGNNSVVIKARGKSISRAFDLMQFAMRVHGMKCPLDADHFTIGSESVESKKEKDKKIWVTCVAITLDKA